MNVCRFHSDQSPVRLGVAAPDDTVIDLTPAGLTRLDEILAASDPLALLRSVVTASLPRVPLSGATLCAPVDRQEVWAAGVTYLRSKAARMEESDFSARAYDAVYAADRPEIFFKAVGEKVVGPEAPVGIRRDARWSVPEPELALVLNPQGAVVGCTIGNDMSSRDIEGENLLYLPQAKVYDRACALGPWITLGVPEPAARRWTIQLVITRAGRVVFSGSTPVAQLKRTFADLSDHLFRSQSFPHGVFLLTGTGIVPPDEFTLSAGDWVEIAIDGLGTLRNPVVVV